MADGCGLGGAGEVDRLVRPGRLARLVRLAGENLGRKCMVTGVPRAGMRPTFWPRMNSGGTDSCTGSAPSWTAGALR